MKLAKSLGAKAQLVNEVATYLSSKDPSSFKSELEKSGGAYRVQLKDGYDSSTMLLDVSLKLGHDFFFSVQEKLTAKA
jgi:hypothetical protein